MGWRNNLEISEFEVHSEAYQNLKNKYKNVRGEFHFKKDGKRAGRFDIALLNDSNEVEMVIEVKRNKNSRSIHQLYKYGELTGKPVVYIRGLAQAREAFSIVHDTFRQSGLTKLEESLRI